MKRLKSLVSEQSQIKHLSTRLFRPQTLVLSQSTPFEVIGAFNQTRVRYYAARLCCTKLAYKVYSVL